MRHLLAACVVWLVVVRPVDADAGTLRLVQALGEYHVTILTAPTPLRVGKAEITVIVESADRGHRIENLAMPIRYWPRSHPERVHSAGLRRDHGLFPTAVLEFGESGAWVLQVGVDREVVVVDVTVANAMPRWTELWQWFAWPLIPMIFFVAERFCRR